MDINRDGRCPCYYCKGTKLSDKIAQFIINFQRFLGEKVIITSGARCPHYNRIVGGASNSPHLIDTNNIGHAVDFTVVGMKPIEVAFKIEQFTQEGRTGIYQRHIHKDFMNPAPSKYWYVNQNYYYSQGLNDLYKFLLKLKSEGRLSNDDIRTFDSGSFTSSNKTTKEV